jgi:hypothetical protein
MGMHLLIEGTAPFSERERFQAATQAPDGQCVGVWLTMPGSWGKGGVFPPGIALNLTSLFEKRSLQPYPMKSNLKIQRRDDKRRDRVVTML